MRDPAQTRVLVVDDERLARGIVCHILRSCGYQVTEAMDWPSTLHAVVTETPHVVILDVNLPGLNGDEIAGMLDRTFSRSLGLVLYSGMEPADIARLAARVGTPYYFRKGGSATEIRETIEKVLSDPAHARTSRPGLAEDLPPPVSQLLPLLKKEDDGRPGVLVIDDQPVFGRLARVGLEAAGFHVRLATNRTEASLGLSCGARVAVLGMSPAKLEEFEIAPLLHNFPGPKRVGILWSDLPTLEVPGVLAELRITRFLARDSAISKLVDEVRKAHDGLN